MIVIAKRSEEEIRQAWESKAPVQVNKPQKLSNLRAVLDLGSDLYFPYQGRAYRVPPLPVKRGAQIMQLWMEAESFGDQLDRTSAPRYFAVVQGLQELIWESVEPVGIPLQILRMLGLLRNPFRRATEQEVIEIANFLLSCRRRSSVQGLKDHLLRNNNL